MRRLIEIATERRVTITMMMTAIVLFGMVSLSRLNLNLLPDISYPTLTVRAELTGAAPVEIENLLSKPIEEAVGVVRNVRLVRSVSRSGQADITVEFLWGTDMDMAGIDIREKLDILRQADAVYLDEIRKAGLYDKIWQAFAVLLPVQTVGVMGDSRTYEFVCALRAVTSVDGMTADFYPYDMEFLGRAATRIINEVRGINRVVYDVTSKPPGTIEWE